VHNWVYCVKCPHFLNRSKRKTYLNMIGIVQVHVLDPPNLAFQLKNVMKQMDFKVQEVKLKITFSN